MSYVPEKHHGAQSPVQFFGIPFWLSLIIMVSGLAVGVLLSTASGELGLTYKICFLVTVLFVAIATEPKSIFLTVASIPLLFVTATVIALLLLARQATSGTAGGLTSRLIHLYPLLEQFPVLITATIGAAVIGAVRLFLLRKSRRSAQEATTRERRQANEQARRSAAQASRARNQSQRSEVRNAKERARNRAKTADTAVTVEELLKRNNPKEDTNASGSLISPATGHTQVIRTNRDTGPHTAAPSTMPGRSSGRRDNREHTAPNKPKVQRRPAQPTAQPAEGHPTAGGRTPRPAQRRAAAPQDPQTAATQRRSTAAGQPSNRRQRSTGTQPPTRQSRNTMPPHQTERSTPTQSHQQRQQSRPVRQRASQLADRLRSNQSGSAAVNQQRSPQQRAQARNAQQRAAQPRVQRAGHGGATERRNPQRGASQAHGGQQRSGAQRGGMQQRGGAQAQPRNAQQRGAMRSSEHQHPTRQGSSSAQRSKQAPSSPQRRTAQQRGEGRVPNQRNGQQRGTPPRTPQQRTRQQQNSHSDVKREEPKQRRRRSLNDDLYS